MLEGFELSEASLRCTITWAGAEYPCTGGPEVGGKRIDQGGYRAHANVKIKVRTEVFEDSVGQPAEKDIIYYKRSADSDPKKYRIDAIVNFYDAALELHCVDPNEN